MTELELRKHLFLEMHVHGMMQTKYTAGAPDMDCSQQDYLAAKYH